MNLSPSTYYKRPDEGHGRLSAQSDTALQSAIETLLRDWPQYGDRRVTAELRRRGIIVNHKRVARVMREQALTVRRVRRFVAPGSERSGEPAYPNLTRGLVQTGPDQLWVADITYIRLRMGFVYLAVLIDAWSRKVVGYAVSSTMQVQLTLTALEAAVHCRSPGAGLIHHSDRGSQYLAKAYRERLAELGIQGSMSRPATPTDNAKAESFMKTLKHEERHAHEYDTLKDVRERLPRFVDDIYNRKRLHSALRYLTPEEFELKHAQRAVS
jgi:putative transposase